MTRTWSGMVQDGCCPVQDIHSDALNTTIHNLRVASSDTTNLRPSKHFLPWRSFQHALEFGAFYSWTFLIFFGTKDSCQDAGLQDFWPRAAFCGFRCFQVTSSALYNMDDAGGFDNYILRTPPQELLSSHGRPNLHWIQWKFHGENDVFKEMITTLCEGVA